MPSEPPLRISDLTEPEQRMLGLARDDMPLAELAVRLGVPVGDAATRLEALCARLGVEDRAALRALSFADGPPREASATATAETAAGRPNRYSRRRILSAGLAGGLAIAGGAAGLAYWATQGGSKSPAAAPSPTREPTATASATATPTPINQLTLIQDTPLNVWERKLFAPGEEITWASGAFYMDIDTGAIEAWRIASEAGIDPNSGVGLGVYRTINGGDLITAQTTNAQSQMFAVSRSLGRAFRWPEGTIYLMDSLADGFVFTDADAPRPQPLFLTKPDLSPRSTIVAEQGLLQSQIVASPDGRAAAFFEAPAQSQMARLRLVAIDSGKTLATHDFHPEAGEIVRPQGIFPIPGSTDFMVSALYLKPDKANPPGPSRTIRMRVPWSGSWDQLAELPGSPVGSFSPDGRSESAQDILRQSREPGLGGVGDWTAVTVRDLDGPRRFSILSASRPFFSFSESSWLADGSALVLMTEDITDNESGYDNIRYVLADADGKTLTPLKIPPPTSSDYPFGLLWRPPVPHATDANRIALGLIEVLNLQTGTSVRANLGSNALPLLGQPWLGRSRELAFSLPAGGKDGPGLPSFIAPVITRNALPAEPLKFLVARTGDCLNVRNGPTLKDDVIACLADGTPLTLADRHAIEGASTASYARNEDGAWVYVSTAGGLTGWVAAAYLDWAL